MSTSDQSGGPLGEGEPSASATPADAPQWPDSFETPDGTTHHIREPHLATGDQFDAELIAIAQPMEFDRCPICLAPNPTDREHVPPASIGGRIMTLTCKRCNNLAGTRLEAAFDDWFHDRIRTRFSHPAFPGQRHGPRMRLLETTDGQTLFTPEGNGGDPAVNEMFERDGDVTVHPIGPDQNRALLAALKSSYLAACLIVRSIPDTLEAVAMRRAILAGIAVPRRRPVPMDHVAPDLWFARLPGTGVRGEVALAHATFEGHDEPRFTISFARKFLVSWPIGGNLVGLGQDQNPTFVRPM